MNSDLASIGEEMDEDTCDRRNISDEKEIRSDEEHSLGCTPMFDTPPFSVCDQLYSWTPSFDTSVVPDDDVPPTAKRMKADLEKPGIMYPQSSTTESHVQSHRVHPVIVENLNPDQVVPYQFEGQSFDMRYIKMVRTSGEETILKHQPICPLDGTKSLFVIRDPNDELKHWHYDIENLITPSITTNSNDLSFNCNLRDQESNVYFWEHCVTLSVDNTRVYLVKIPS